MLTDFPASKPALFDLKDCLARTQGYQQVPCPRPAARPSPRGGERWGGLGFASSEGASVRRVVNRLSVQVVMQLRRVFQQRLLQPGATTPQVIDIYIATIKARPRPRRCRC